ncbi:MAG: histidinol dehydrogenase [Alphaproteobacteria bacterium]|nr:histidinol dehydrogenase [Alphaproteobacteria bacterium]
MARRLDAGAPGFECAFQALLTEDRGGGEDVTTVVRAIIADVRQRGDDALRHYTEQFDKAATETLRVPLEEIAAAESQCKPEELAALDTAARRIEAYHRRQLPKDERFKDETGIELGWRWTALESVGLYVPGGTASYPSSVLMNAVPARVAGVARIVMTTPASGGRINPLVLAAAKRAGVTEIYGVGGAQAIAALAYGTTSIAPVDKIVGPGNAYVAEAKRQVFGQVGIDSIAGPSEILVVGDGSVPAAWIAADLLSQAEHDPSSQCILVTQDTAFADRVEAAVARALETLPRRAIAEASWRDRGAIVVVSQMEDAVALIDRVAPEHLELAVQNPDALLARVRHAGAIFLGSRTPEALGDYIAGPNHVLPTSRSARFSSGLSVLDFLKRTTLLACPRAALEILGPQAVALARAEGLEAHARSIAVRLDDG